MDELEDLFNEDLATEPIVDAEITPVEVPSEIDTFFENDDDNIDTKTENSLIDTFLKGKGIENSKVTILDENDEEKEVDFYTLTKEEQLEILNAEDSNEEDLGLEDSEIDLINHLRTNNLTVDDFLESYKKSIMDSINEDATPNYDIDAYDDQELFMLDLQQKYDLTGEELGKELEKELQDKTLFKKKVDVLRTEYKQLEDQYKEGQQKEADSQKEEQYNVFSDQMVDVALKTPSFYGIELEDDEKNEVLSYILDLDDNGTSNFYKTLNDPKKLYEAAWFLRYGKESFDALKNAYESEISKIKKQDKTQVIHKIQDDHKQQDSIHDLF